MEVAGPRDLFRDRRLEAIEKGGEITLSHWSVMGC
jgi:hypothetical protein